MISLLGDRTKMISLSSDIYEKYPKVISKQKNPLDLKDFKNRQK